MQVNLEMQGHSVDLVETGTIALTRLKAEPYNLLIVCPIIEDMTSSELISQIQWNPALEQLEIIDLKSGLSNSSRGCRPY